MAVTEQPPMLENDDLRDVDQTILSYMDDGRVTPVYCKKRLSDDGMDYSRGYVQERLFRLVEHDHAENLLGTGLYELVDDPRDAGSQETLSDATVEADEIVDTLEEDETDE